MEQKKTIRDEPNREVLTFLKQAGKEYSQLPVWKQRMLQSASSPFSAAPRQPALPSESSAAQERR